MINSKKTIFTVFALVYFGISIDPKFLVVDKKYSLDNSKEIKLSFSLEGIKPVLAANSSWDGVRAIATFTKDVVKGIDTILKNLSGSGILKQSSKYTVTSDGYTYRINPTFNTSVTSNAFGSKTYKVSFEIWKASDNSKVLELFFDSATDQSTGSGVLAIWQPNKFDSTLNQTNSPKMECAMTGGTADGTMICSWNGGPFETDGPVENGRVKVKATSATSQVSIKAIAKTVTTTTCSGGNPDYYGLAFIVKKSDSTNYATARMGFNDNSIASTLCGTSNTYNSAYFNNTTNSSSSGSGKYFVTDGITSDTNSYNTGSVYPSVNDVSTLYSEINTTDSDMTITNVNSISVAFRSTAAP